MTVGLAGTLAQSLLNLFRGVAYTAPTNVYCKLHIGDPGAAGTGNPSAVTTRNTVTWNAATTGGSMSLASLPAFSMTASETISHISLWDNVSAGNFLQSAALTSSVPVINGSTLTFSSLTLSYSPIAA